MGNQYTKKCKDWRANENHQSFSIKKLKIPPSLAAADLSDDHYILINFLILQESMKTVNGAVLKKSALRT